MKPQCAWNKKAWDGAVLFLVRDTETRMNGSSSRKWGDKGGHHRGHLPLGGGGVICLNPTCNVCRIKM